MRKNPKHKTAERKAMERALREYGAAARKQGQPENSLSPLIPTWKRAEWLKGWKNAGPASSAGGR